MLVMYPWPASRSGSRFTDNCDCRCRQPIFFLFPLTKAKKEIRFYVYRKQENDNIAYNFKSLRCISFNEAMWIQFTTGSTSFLQGGRGGKRGGAGRSLDCIVGVLRMSMTR